MRVRQAGDYRTMAWKNGGGSTTEVEIWPPGASLETFDWRLSMARIEADGPFSSFPGIDRTLTLLDGSLVELEVDGKRSSLTPERPTLHFAGEDRVTSWVPEGPIVDFNVMTRRARCSHRFQQIDIAGPREVKRVGGITILFLAHGAALSCRAAGSGEVLLAARSCLLLEADDPATWQVETAAPTTIFRIDIV